MIQLNLSESLNGRPSSRQTRNSRQAMIHRITRIATTKYHHSHILDSPILCLKRSNQSCLDGFQIAQQPKPNLTPLEMIGRKWLLDKIESESIFVTTADKGGATLILNFTDIKAAIWRTSWSM